METSLYRITDDAQISFFLFPEFVLYLDFPSCSLLSFSLLLDSFIN